MGYANVIECDLFIGQALTSARPDSTFAKIKLTNINNVRDLNRIPTEMVEFFIATGDEVIDGILSQQYATPLRKCPSGQWELDSDIDEYNQIVELSDATNLVPGDEIIIRDDNTGIEEVHIVNSVIDQHSITTVSAILTNFSGDEVRVLRLKFPPPISQVSARFAASYIYDKYFAAQNSPNESEYGKAMRNIAYGQLNDILNGKVILSCQRRVGDLPGNPWVDSSYSQRTPVDGYNTSDRDLSKPG